MENSQNNFSSNLLRGIRYRMRELLRNKYEKADLNWFSVKKLKHLPANGDHSIRLKGQTVRFRNGSELFHSLVEIYVNEVYKTTFDNTTPYIIDCGSNIGLSVLYFSQNHPGAEIDAFEPDPTNYSLLKSNISANSKVRLHNEAVWIENTTLSFINDGTLGSKIGKGKEATTVQVKAVRLKEMLNRKVDFLKMDIEGAEYDVLKDCRQELANVSQLFIEFHGHFKKSHELTEILQLVEESGFSYYIKEAAEVYETPFFRSSRPGPYDLQLNIFCFRIK